MLFPDWVFVWFITVTLRINCPDLFVWFSFLALLAYYNWTYVSTSGKELLIPASYTCYVVCNELYMPKWDHTKWHILHQKQNDVLQIWHTLQTLLKSSASINPRYWHISFNPDMYLCNYIWLLPRVYACTVGLSAREYVFHVMYTRNWARFCIRDIPLIPLSLIFPNGINRLMPRHNYPPWHWSFLFVFASFLFVWNRRVIE